ncbi:MAG: hypothetical protein LBQ80_04800 [Clostridium sp.]|jgi:hypothetical protein|nr:hypothetical protein [Clostridium sp.]
MRKNKTIILVMALLLSALTICSAASFAWFTAKDEKTNHLESYGGDGNVELVDIFDESAPLLPEDASNSASGVEKQVGAVNTGKVPAFVRISFAEALTKLSSQEPLSSATAYSGTDYAAGKLPHVYADEAFAAGGAYDGWQTPISNTGAVEDLTLNLPSELKSKVTLLYNVTKLNGGNHLEFVAYLTITGLTGDAAKYNGQKQVVELEYALTKGTDPSVEDDYDVLVTAPSSGAYKYWQRDAEVKDKLAALLPSHAPFDNDTDYPVSTPAAADITAGVLASRADSLIKLGLGANVKTAVAAASKGDWVYNEDDGYFYYIGVLGAGQQTSSWLLSKVLLDSSAGNAYAHLDYKLTPILDGLQATDEALSAWGLDPTLAGSIGEKLASLN